MRKPLLFILLLFCMPAFSQETASFLFNKGYNYLLIDKSVSVDYFSQSIEKDTAFSIAYYYRGLANYKLGNYELAITDFEQAYKIDENLVKCHIYIGFAQQQLNNNADALKAFESYMAKQKQVTRSDHLVVAKSKANNGDLKGALKEYQLALSEKPSEEQLYRLFLATYENGDYEQSLDLINQIIELNPTFYGYYLHKGKVELYIRQFNKAVHNFNLAMGLNPEIADAYFLKATALDTLQRLDEALINFSAAIQLNPSDGTYYSKRGNTKMTMGNRNGACLDWTIAGKLGYYADFDKIKTICEKTIIKNK